MTGQDKQSLEELVQNAVKKVLFEVKGQGQPDLEKLAEVIAKKERLNQTVII